MTQIELIDYRLIFDDPQNPRKSFNKEAISELAENIKQQGLLQPITVRPYPTMNVESPKYLSGKPCYKIVMGARRYKACVEADFAEIPVIVRNMTDEQAFDAMITENLQRKDVEPLEEARAFAELNHRGTTFEELAARFGKSLSYIRLRIKLNDLIPEFIELLDKKELQLSHAQELCKLSPDYQKEIFKERYSQDAESWANWTDKSLKDIRGYLQSDFKNLDNAKFDKTECETCEFRCGVSALFQEYESNTCTKPACFKDKTFHDRLETALQKINEGYILVKREGRYTKDEVIDELERLGHVLIENNYKHIDWESPAEYPERDEDYSDEDWAEALAYYEKDAAKESARLESGEYKKAWFVGHWSDDMYKLITFKNNNISSPEEAIRNQDIIAIKEKAKRNEELKSEKIIEDLRKLMSESQYQDIETPITEIEKVAIFALMLKNCDYSFKRNTEQEFKAELTPFENIKALAGTPAETRIIREFIKR
ncbi:MAG: hypothetical protein BGO29_14925 [Bacteroidales bacterium 36-12]|nr:MAG: hypothetical protein BGO29_14925 [Bacteroidales bacterium 36-12]